MLLDPTQGLIRGNPIGDGLANTSIGLIDNAVLNLLDIDSGANPNVWTYVVQRANASKVLNKSDAATTNYDSGVLNNYNWKGIYLVVDVTSITGTSITPAVLGIDPLSTKTFQLHANFTAIVGTGTYVYEIGSSTLTAAAGGITAVAQAFIPRQFKVTVTKNTISVLAATYAVIGMI